MANAGGRQDNRERLGGDIPPPPTARGAAALVRIVVSSMISMADTKEKSPAQV